jgi:hypothetical protein
VEGLPKLSVLTRTYKKKEEIKYESASNAELKYKIIKRNIVHRLLIYQGRA